MLSISYYSRQLAGLGSLFILMSAILAEWLFPLAIVVGSCRLFTARFLPFRP